MYSNDSSVLLDWLACVQKNFLTAQYPSESVNSSYLVNNKTNLKYKIFNIFKILVIMIECEAVTFTTTYFSTYVL